MRFGQFLAQRIFEPLGMKDTGFYVPKDKQDRLAKVYRDGESGLVEEHGYNLAIQNKMEVPPAFESGGAGLCSTIDDYARFAQMLMNRGEYGGVRYDLVSCDALGFRLLDVTPDAPESEKEE